jgi:hypothetical protein
MTPSLRMVVVALWLAPLAVGLSPAKEKDPLNVEKGALDEIHLKVPAISGGVPVILRPFSTAGCNFGTGGDDAKNVQRSDATRTLAKVGPEYLRDSLKASLSESHVFGELLTGGTEAIPDNALVVEGSFVRIDPGSRAKRYWISFGAGLSGVQVKGTVKDASGKVLAEFTHFRRSGIGLGGGDYVKFLTDDTKDVGSDIGLFLVTWAGGGDLHLRPGTETPPRDPSGDQ